MHGIFPFTYMTDASDEVKTLARELSTRTPKPARVGDEVHAS